TGGEILGQSRWAPTHLFQSALSAVIVSIRSVRSSRPPAACRTIDATRIGATAGNRGIGRVGSFLERCPTIARATHAKGRCLMPAAPIKFRCFRCSQLLGVARSKAGAVVACPKCGVELIVPETEETEPRSDVGQASSEGTAVLKPGTTPPAPSEE